MPHNFDKWLMLLVSLIGTVQAWLAHRKAAEAVKHAAAAADAAEALQEHPALAVPSAGAPGVSLPQMLRFWDLLSKLISYWGGFKKAPIKETQLVPLIKTKIDGRHCEIGPIPVRFLD